MFFRALRIIRHLIPSEHGFVGFKINKIIYLISLILRNGLIALVDSETKQMKHHQPPNYSEVGKRYVITWLVWQSL